MTNPDPCFKDTPGSRITAGLLLALLCLSLLLSAGCARLIPPVKEEPALPLVLVKERKLPEFFDDMSFDALSAAIDQSLAYLRSKSPETQFRFGEETYSATHMIRSLENFTTFLQTRPDGAALNRFIRANYHVYQAAGNRDPGRILVTGYYEPFLKGSHHKSARFQYPLYTRPDDLVSVNLSRFSEKFNGETIWGRLD